MGITYPLTDLCIAEPKLEMVEAMDENKPPLCFFSAISLCKKKPLKLEAGVESALDSNNANEGRTALESIPIWSRV